MLRKLPVLLTAGALSTVLSTGAWAFGPYDADTAPGASSPNTAPEIRSPGTATAPESASPRENTIQGQHLGSPASGRLSVDRRIELRPDMGDIRVRKGDTVVFEGDGQAFAWKFDTLASPAVVELASIAPQNMRVPNVKVYVGEDPLRVAD